MDAVQGDDPFRLQAPPPETGALYFQWCLHRMSVDFPRVKILDLRTALKAHMGRLGPAYRAVSIAYVNAVLKEQKLPVNKEGRKEQSVKWLPCTGLKLMKNPRYYPADLPDASCPIFEKEWTLVQTASSNSFEPKCIPAVQEIECGCCCSDSPFEEMVQCADGHLFCFGCLRRRVEESTFGGLQACGPLSCMDTAGCSQSIPWFEIQRAIPSDLLAKFEQRQADDCLARARLQGLVYCPFCDFACEVDSGMAVFKCPNEPCKKASCIKCKEPSHLPLRCEEVEKPSDTCSRKKIEEIMSKALIRECATCKAQLVKEHGCNKVTCRCGQSMCYVCRKPIKDYKHFCEHLREPGLSCKDCNKCGLWHKEDENTIVNNAKRTAVQDFAKADPTIVNREIGPAENWFTHKRIKS